MTNKKAEIGATLSWIPAIFVMGMILLVYMALATGERAKLGQVQYEIITTPGMLKDTIMLQSISTLIKNEKLSDLKLLKKICESYDLRYLVVGRDYSQDPEYQRLDKQFKRKVDFVYYHFDGQNSEQKRLIFRGGLKC